MNRVTDPRREQGLRTEAVSRLRKRRDFKLHLQVYVAVNAALVVVWVSTGGPFWPAFPMLGWGLGVLINAWEVYWRQELGEGAIQNEIERLRNERAR